MTKIKENKANKFNIIHLHFPVFSYLQIRHSSLKLIIAPHKIYNSLCILFEFKNSF